MYVTLFHNIYDAELVKNSLNTVGLYAFKVFAVSGSIAKSKLD